MTKKSTSKPKNAANSQKLRHPSNFPKSVQWKLEGDAELLKRLNPEEAEFFKTFLEAHLGSNPQLLTDDQDKIREVWRENKRNERDPHTIMRNRDRVDASTYESQPLPKRVDTETPTPIQERQVVSIDVCQRDTATNSIEDSMIALLDEQNRRQAKPRKVHRLDVVDGEPVSKVPATSVRRRAKNSNG